MSGAGLKVGDLDRVIVLEADPDLVRREGHPLTGGFHQRFLGCPELEKADDGPVAQPGALFREEKLTGDHEGREGGVDGLDVETDAAVPPTDRQRDPFPGVGEIEISARVIRQKRAAMGGGGKVEGVARNLEMGRELLFRPGAAIDPTVTVMLKMKSGSPGLLNPAEDGEGFRGGEAVGVMELDGWGGIHAAGNGQWKG